MVSCAVPLLVIFLTVTVANAATTPRITIRVGMLMPETVDDLTQLIGFTTSAAAVSMAIDRINEEHLLDQVDWE